MLCFARSIAAWILDSTHALVDSDLAGYWSSVAVLGFYYRNLP